MVKAEVQGDENSKNTLSEDEERGKAPSQGNVFLCRDDACDLCLRCQIIDTVGALKEETRDVNGCPIGRQRLCAGKTHLVEDERALLQHGIAGGCAVRVRLGLPSRCNTAKHATGQLANMKSEAETVLKGAGAWHREMKTCEEERKMSLEPVGAGMPEAGAKRSLLLGRGPCVNTALEEVVKCRLLLEHGAMTQSYHDKAGKHTQRKHIEMIKPAVLALIKEVRNDLPNFTDPDPHEDLSKFCLGLFGLRRGAHGQMLQSGP